MKELVEAAQAEFNEEQERKIKEYVKRLLSKQANLDQKLEKIQAEQEAIQLQLEKINEGDLTEYRIYESATCPIEFSDELRLTAYGANLWRSPDAKI